MIIPLSIQQKALKQAVIDLLTENCDQTSDPDIPEQLFKRMTVIVLANGHKRNIRGHTTIVNALSNINANQGTEVEFIIQSDGIFFPRYWDGADLALHQFTPFPTNTMSNAPRPSSGYTPSTPTHTTTKIFNYVALPNDVRARYDAYLDPNVITSPHKMVRYASGDFFYENPATLGSCIITRNGALLESHVDLKSFQRDYPKMTENSPTGFRQFWKRLHDHALSCGVYIPDYWLLDPQRGGSIGFQWDNDIPGNLRDKYNVWQNQLYQLLSKNDVLIADSKYQKVLSTTSNGYVALIQAILDEHPTYVENNARLITSYPRQKSNQTIHSFQDVNFHNF